MSKFVLGAEVPREEVEWGSMAWLSSPPATGNRHLTVVDVSLKPGQGHDFHKHVDQEEVIIVISGTIEQWIEHEKRTIRAGDAAYIDAGVVHASFNVGSDNAKILAILGPCVSDSGYAIEEVASEEPWCSLRVQNRKVES